MGQTPLVKLQRMPCSQSGEVYLKLESFNPTHSYKDRMAAAIIEAAEERGEITPEKIVLECTGGSTGPALAFVCAVKGYRFRVISSDAYSAHKLEHMRALGAEVVLEPSKGGKVTDDLWPRMLRLAQSYLAQGGFFWVDQFHNLDALTGYHEMGREILEQLERPIDAFCGAVGTAGMLMGVGEVLKKRRGETLIAAIEPANAPFLTGGAVQGHNIDGIAAGFVPPLFQRSKVDRVTAIHEEEARRTARELALKEGVFAGTSSGMNVAAALRLARELGPGSVVVTVACDSGVKYLQQADVY